MVTRFLVTNIVDDPYKSGYEEYLIVNGEVFYRDIEEIPSDDYDFPKQRAVVYRCKLRDVPTVSPNDGTVLTHWYQYEPVDLSTIPEIPQSYAERVARIFFGDDNGRMGRVTKVA
jgi:hypothetical protein